MPRPLRYEQQPIRQHLAQQYVLNQLSPLAAKRMEKLMRNDSQLNHLVYRWESKLSTIIDAVPEQMPPERVWADLQRHHLTPEANKTTFFQRWFWQMAFASSLCVLLITSTQLYLMPPQAKTEFSPSYTATMSDSENQQRFILNAYKGLTPGHSQLKILWDKHSTVKSLDNLTLWSIARNTGKKEEIAKINQLTSNKHFLTKANWLKIKNSAYLEIKDGDTVVFRGECIELATIN